jgi:hypothetical protein
MARPMAEGKPAEVIVGADGAPEEILTDEVALTSILRNLLSNGIKYTDHGEVRLSAQVMGPRPGISVAGTGMGMPAGLRGMLAGLGIIATLCLALRGHGPPFWSTATTRPMLARVACCRACPGTSRTWKRRSCRRKAPCC